MKKNVAYYLTFIILSVPGFVNAQTRFAIQNNERSEVFETFGAAIAATLHGDTLYLPGGNFNIGNIVIDKKLTLIGVGHYPEKTSATGITSLMGDIILIGGSDHSLLQGFYLTGTIRLGNHSTTQSVSNIIISRCNIYGITLYYSSPSTAEHILITENVIRGEIIGGSAQNVLIEKNIVNNVRAFNNNASISNNIVLKSSGDTFQNLTSCILQNNIFLHNTSYFLYASSTNTFLNNLFVRSFSIPEGCSGSGNIVSQPLSSIFQNYEGSFFKYEHNYNLQETSPGKNAGTDGKDIGIYGSNFPYKEGAVPLNPNITYQQISPTTNAEGKIEIEIHVSSQER